MSTIAWLILDVVAAIVFVAIAVNSVEMTTRILNTATACVWCLSAGIQIARLVEEVL